MACDDRIYTNGPWVESLENEWYNGASYDHSEFSFHIFTSLWGGRDPSEYFARRGISFRDLIDTNHDNRISAGEAFVWDRHRNSRLGFEDNQMLDLGNLASRFIIWPQSEILEAVGMVEEPKPPPPVKELAYPTVMSSACFSAWLAQHRDCRVYDRSGR